MWLKDIEKTFNMNTTMNVSPDLWQENIFTILINGSEETGP